MYQWSLKKYTENLAKYLYLTNIITAKVCDSGCLLLFHDTAKPI